MKDFRDKVAVVTGAASGIGFALADALGQRGARVVLADIEPDALDAAVARQKDAGVDVLGVVADVGDRAAVDELADLAWNRFGSVNFVAHNAGVVVFSPLVDTTTDDWTWLIRVNLWGAINGVAAFLPRMLASGEEGHMLFTASAGGLSAFSNSSAYCATKAGVVMIAEGLELEHRDSNIGFSVLAPMSTATNIVRSNRNRPVELGGPDANREAVENRQTGQHSVVMSSQDAARLALEGIERGDVFIHTHKAAQPWVAARAERMLSTFTFAS